MQRCSLAVQCALASLPLLLTGCGSAPASSTTTVAPPPQTPTVTNLPIDGRWTFSPYVIVPAGSGTIPVVPGASFQGALGVNGTQVTGAGQIQVSVFASGSLQCARPQAVSLHGTLNAARHLSLTSDALADGGVLQMELDIPSDPHRPSTGTTKLTGSCATTGTIQGLLFEPLSGSFAGAVTTQDATTHQAITLGMADGTFAETTPDATGKSVVSGTINVKLSTCTTQLPISGTRVGSAFELSPPLASSAPFVQLALSELPDGTSVNAGVYNVGQDCKPVEPPAPVSTGTSTIIPLGSANILSIDMRSSSTRGWGCE